MPDSRRPSPNRWYTAYRKLRYLARTGSLFSGKQSDTPADDLPRSRYLVISLNSFFLFVLAALLVYILNLFVTGYVALLFNIPVILYYYDVEFLIRGIDWTPDSVTGVFSSGPIAMFVLTLLLLILYKAVETERGLLRLLILWMVFHAFTRFVGEIVAGAILGKGFGFVLIYLFLTDTGKVVLTLAGLVVIFIFGTMMTRISLYTANTYFNKMVGGQRRRFILSQFLLPFLLGNLLLWLVKLPRTNSFDVSVNVTMLLLLIAVWVRGIRMQDFYFDEEGRKIRLDVVAGLAATAVLVIFRILFGAGVRL